MDEHPTFGHDQDDTEVVPADTQTLHHRLEADGRAWRRRLPSAQGLIERTRHMTATVAAERGADGDRPAVAPPQLTSGWRTSDMPMMQTPVKGQLDMITTRVRGVATGMVAVAVVAMIALLFYTFATSRSGTGTGLGPGASATATSAHGVWQTLAGLTFTTSQQGPGALPAISPANPNTVYQATLGPIKLRRTTDQGAHWAQLHVPGDTSNVEAFQVFVSPLDATHVFLTLTSPLPPQSQASACPTIAASQAGTVAVRSRLSRAGALAANLPQSGTIPCSLQYNSTDGGDSWQQLTLPVRSVLIDPPALFGAPTSHLLRAQGSRLYAAAGCGPNCFGPSSDIVTSTDGGAHWTQADQAIRAAGHNVCDFAASPTGNDVIAITATQSCGSETVPPAYLWHSADAGAHWTKVGQLPANAWLGLAVVAQTQGQPLLYVHLPQVTVQGHGSSMTDGPTYLRVSADGGKTWKAAPATGIASTSRPFTGPLCVLSDGSVVENFGDPMATTLYGWKLGEAAWHQVTAPIKGDVGQVLVVTQGGADTLLAVTVASYNQSGVSTSGETIRVQSYLP
jgi:hypothetical protein